MQNYHLITPLEGDLSAVIELLPRETETHWLLDVKILHSGEPVADISFNLDGHTQEEALELAHNLPKHGYIMREIDDLLFGDSE
ncbi:hypothetical protein [Marinospirillum perlucidum]|uniref:hypothetical protein n=1 Tax=Marinospirillum perlucidum TaxID=1982602 RepID=UPI000DF26285|nr:hypothetical protein [Marinospirillum perlucidum]